MDWHGNRWRVLATEVAAKVGIQRKCPIMALKSEAGETYPAQYSTKRSILCLSERGAKTVRIKVDYVACSVQAHSAVKLLSLMKL